MEKLEINKFISSKDNVFVLDKDGLNFSSKDFAGCIKDEMIQSTKKIVFLIGSDEGIHEDLKNAYKTLSFGKQTWPHLLIRVMLIEQIYRAFQIIEGTSYHK